MNFLSIQSNGYHYGIFPCVGSLYFPLIHSLPPPNVLPCALWTNNSCHNTLHNLGLKSKCYKKQLRKSPAEKVQHNEREECKKTQNSGGVGKHDTKSVRNADWRFEAWQDRLASSLILEYPPHGLATRAPGPSLSPSSPPSKQGHGLGNSSRPRTIWQFFASLKTRCILLDFTNHPKCLKWERKQNQEKLWVCALHSYFVGCLTVCFVSYFY